MADREERNQRKRGRVADDFAQLRCSPGGCPAGTTPAPIVVAVTQLPDAERPNFGASGDSANAPMLRLGVDVGGTFTDVVTVDAAGHVVTAKVPSTPADSSAGVIAGWRALAEPAALVEVFAHGTTVATNALLERRGGRTALVTTEGFRDLIEIGRQNRASLYDLTRHRPPPLVPRGLRFVVRERMGPGGIIAPVRR